MAATIEPSEPGAKGARRILRKQLDKALESLAVQHVTDRKVHDARKRIKKARAALRLLRDAIGKSEYTRENAALRDVARPLSQVRDSKVLLDTLEKLNERFDNACRGLPVDELRRALNHERRKLRHEVLGQASGLRPGISTLRKVRSRTRRWDLDSKDWSVIGCGLRRVYASGRRALLAVESEGSPECFHEWRKQVKYLRHQLEFLEPVWPGALCELAQEAHKLADDLGDEHDLTVLREKAREHGDAGSPELSAVLALIDRQRSELRDNALSRGRQLYAEKAGVFATRLRGYWDNWHEACAKH
jgi:CHAD domain-containing protein